MPTRGKYGYDRGARLDLLDPSLYRNGMPHKLDRMRHRRDVINRKRALRKKYLKLTQNDTIPPEKALATLKDQDQVETVKELARQLAARGVFVRFAPER